MKLINRYLQLTIAALTASSIQAVMDGARAKKLVEEAGNYAAKLTKFNEVITKVKQDPEIIQSLQDWFDKTVEEPVRQQREKIRSEDERVLQDKKINQLNEKIKRAQEWAEERNNEVTDARLKKESEANTRQRELQSDEEDKQERQHKIKNAHRLLDENKDLIDLSDEKDLIDFSDIDQPIAARPKSSNSSSARVTGYAPPPAINANPNTSTNFDEPAAYTSTILPENTNPNAVGVSRDTQANSNDSIQEEDEEDEDVSTVAPSQANDSVQKEEEGEDVAVAAPSHANSEEDLYADAPEFIPFTDTQVAALNADEDDKELDPYVSSTNDNEKRVLKRVNDSMKRTNVSFSDDIPTTSPTTNEEQKTSASLKRAQPTRIAKRTIKARHLAKGPESNKRRSRRA